MDENSVEITGIAGRFPGCDNTVELQKALEAEKDLVSDYHGRWPEQFYGLNDRAGVMKDIDSFDAGFFAVTPRQADGSDPRTRILLEVIFEALVDAGVNSTDIKGSRTGVFLGMAAGNSNEPIFENRLSYTRLGRSTALAAGMIAFAYDLRGPSYAIDTACSSSLFAFCQAAQAIRSGECDAAIVCGATIILDPYDSLDYKRLHILSDVGKCQFLDEKRDGFVKSESVVVTFLQKRKDARRIYATVMGSGTNTDGLKVEGMTNPSIQMQATLMEDIYQKFKIDPNDVTYIEAHGTGTQVGDIHETTAIAKALCKDREGPLLIGSVKTNIGHTEMASGLTSIIKVILSMEYGTIPAMLHLDKIGEGFTAFEEGKLKAVTENTPWKGGLAAVNSFGIGGANAHVVLRPSVKRKIPFSDGSKYRLVQVGGRTEQGVRNILDSIKKNPNDTEFFALIDNIFHRPIQKYFHRGYIILGGSQELEDMKVAKEGIPIWYVYSGIGSQWPGMAKDLMNLEVFRSSMEICARTVKPYGIDLMDVVINGTAETFKNTINCFISIISMSVCLTDVLKQLDIEPDGIIGHSVGEISCAYADGIITKEEAMLIGYARGYAINKSNTPLGALAVVGLTNEELLKRIPNNVSIACYNCVDNITISGSVEAVTSFVDQLKAEELFAEIIPGANVAYHSKYIEEAGEHFGKLLSKIILKPTPRSNKWISTSIPENEWQNELKNNHSVEYHTNNFVNPVLFHEAVKHIPKNAIVIEISPKGLLQTVLRRNLGLDIMNIPLSSDTVEDNLAFFLSAIGRTYLGGANSNLRKFYNDFKVLPASSGTPSIAPLIDWDHSAKSQVDYYSPAKSFGDKVVIDLKESFSKYLEGHMVQGKMIYPVVGYAFMAWEVFARLNKRPLSEVPIIIDTLKIRRMTLLNREGSTVFTVNILNSTGHFEISEGGSVVADGIIREPEDMPIINLIPDSLIPPDDKYLPMNQEEIYEVCSRIGLQYENEFRVIQESESNACRGKLKWSTNWVPFLDSMIHYTLLHNPNSLLCLPESMGRIVINPQAHLKLAKESNNVIPIKYDPYASIIQAGGIEIRDLEMIQLPKRKIHENPTLERYRYVPYNLQNNTQIGLHDALSLTIQIVLENLGEHSTIKILELTGANDEQAKEENDLERNLSDVESQPEEPIFTKTLKQVLKEGTTKVEHHTYQMMNIPIKVQHATYNLITLSFQINGYSLHEIKLLSNTFVLFLVSDKIGKESLLKMNYVIISEFSTENGIYLLTRPRIVIAKDSQIITITNSTFSWVNELKEGLKVASENKTLLYIVSQGEKFSGIIGLMNCLRFEEGGSNVRSVFVVDENVEKFSLDSPFFREQLEKNLSVNVFKNNLWGSYRFSKYQKLLERETSRALVNISSFGNFSQMKLFESSPFYKNPDRKILVYYTGVNFKDILIAEGLLRMPGKDAENFKIGFEVSGKNVAGTRVMGLVSGNGFATELEGSLCTWKIPEHWSLEEAATVPVVYSTVYFAFFISTKLEPSDTILIHCGSGGVGIAAIQTALALGCEVYATVGSQEKKEFLLKYFPKLIEENIGNSRDDTFETLIKRKTKGRGVDVVLNSLANDLFDASMRCVAIGGRHIEIGKVEFLSKTTIKSAPFMKNITFHVVSLDMLTGLGKHCDKVKLYNLIQKGLDNGDIKPIQQRTVFDLTDIQEAFEYYRKTIHTGKVVIKIRDEKINLGTTTNSRILPAIPKVHFDPNKSYIIIGGLGGLGQQLAIWINEHGGEKIIINSRSGVTTGSQSFFLRYSLNMGSEIHLNNHDCTIAANAEKLIIEANKIAPVGGIFNLALVIRDGLLDKQTPDNFRDVYSPKVNITQNLDLFSRKLCPELEFFVAYSSISCGKGNLGQTNYGFANSAMERICEVRNEDGLPGLVIQWGPVADMGYFARSNIKLEFGTLAAQPTASCDAVLEHFLTETTGIVSSILLRDTTQTIMMGATLLGTVMKLFGITDAKKLSDKTTLLELGMDSLMAFEIKQYLYREYEVDISVKNLRDLTVKEIEEIDKKEKNQTQVLVQT